MPGDGLAQEQRARRDEYLGALQCLRNAVAHPGRTGQAGQQHHGVGMDAAGPAAGDTGGSTDTEAIATSRPRRVLRTGADG